jgi:hypothetical protein
MARQKQSPLPLSMSKIRLPDASRSQVSPCRTALPVASRASESRCLADRSAELGSSMEEERDCSVILALLACYLSLRPVCILAHLGDGEDSHTAGQALATRAVGQPFRHVVPRLLDPCPASLGAMPTSAADQAVKVRLPVRRDWTPRGSGPSSWREANCQLEADRY